MKIGIISYGIGNVGSVVGCINNIGVEYQVIKEKNEFNGIDKLILPGVGNFKKCKEILDKKNFTKIIREKVLINKTPILGICLGMQLLAYLGSEGNNEGFSEGLKLIKGNVENLKKLGSKSILPHIGWNSVKIQKPAPIVKNIPNNTDFYFVHSYAFTNIKKEYVIAETNYGIDFPVIIQYQNVLGTQFHPEKSSKAGQEIIKNFINS